MIKNILLTLLLFSIQFEIKSQEVSILFLGNSLTYTNDLPSLISHIGKENDIDIIAHSICLPNYGLEDHFANGDFQRPMDNYAFDYVIFQQGPSSQAYGRESLIEYGAKIKAVCMDNGATPAYFMVWTSIGYYHTFDDVIKNHNNAGSLNDVQVLPVGEVWKEFHDSNSNSGLYSFDQFHPSKKGTFLAAAVIMSQLFPQIEWDAKPQYVYKKWVDKKNYREIVEHLSNMKLAKLGDE